MVCDTFDVSPSSKRIREKETIFQCNANHSNISVYQLYSLCSASMNTMRMIGGRKWTKEIDTRKKNKLWHIHAGEPNCSTTFFKLSQKWLLLKGFIFLTFPYTYYDVKKKHNLKIKHIIVHLYRWVRFCTNC